MGALQAFIPPDPAMVFGTTAWGGTNSLAGLNCCGTIFGVEFGYPETVFYSFCSAAYCRDGARPESGWYALRHSHRNGSRRGGQARDDGGADGGCCRGRR
jgi:hypothetical protein